MAVPATFQLVRADDHVVAQVFISNLAPVAVSPTRTQPSPFVLKPPSGGGSPPPPGALRVRFQAQQIIEYATPVGLPLPFTGQTCRRLSDAAPFDPRWEAKGRRRPCPKGSSALLPSTLRQSSRLSRTGVAARACVSTDLRYRQSRGGSLCNQLLIL